MQHTQLIVLLGLMASLSACGLPRASDINAPRSSDEFELGLPAIVLSTPESAEPESAELEPEEIIATVDESAIETPPTLPVTPEATDAQAVSTEDCPADEEDDDYEDDDEHDDDDDLEDGCEDDDNDDDDDDADRAI